MRDPEVSIRPSPFGSQRPTIPIATTVNIARVASAFSTDRTYQPLFLQALQGYFKDTTRLVKQGDVIAVAINTDDLSRHHGASEDEDADDLEIELELVAISYCAEQLLTGSQRSRVSGRAQRSRVLPHHKRGTQRTVTPWRGVLVGHVHCRYGRRARLLGRSFGDAHGADRPRACSCAGHGSIPWHWYDHRSCRCTPCIHRGIGQRVFAPANDIQDPDTPYGKLLALASAALNRRAVDYHLQLSILLEGPRGVGKSTTASWVAQRLGIHVLEVSNRFARCKVSQFG